MRDKNHDSQKIRKTFIFHKDGANITIKQHGFFDPDDVVIIIHPDKIELEVRASCKAKREI